MVYATLVVRRASSLNFMVSKPKLSTQLLQSQNRRSCTLATTPFPTKLSILRHSLSFQIFRAPHEIRSSSPCTGTRCLCKGTSQIFTRISLLPKLMAEAWLKHKLQVPSYMSCQNLKHETESTLAPRVEIYFEFFVASSCSWTTANPWKKCNNLSNQLFCLNSLLWIIFKILNIWVWKRKFVCRCWSCKSGNAESFTPGATSTMSTGDRSVTSI